MFPALSHHREADVLSLTAKTGLITLPWPGTKVLGVLDFTLIAQTGSVQPTKLIRNRRPQPFPFLSHHREADVLGLITQTGHLTPTYLTGHSRAQTFPSLSHHREADVLDLITQTGLVTPTNLTEHRRAQTFPSLSHHREADVLT